jgi:hypothetical protein
MYHQPASSAGHNGNARGNMRSHVAAIVLVVIAGSTGMQAMAREPLDFSRRGGWLEAGVGAASVSMQTTGLPERQGTAVVSMGLGYQATRAFGVGVEYASSAPLYGCRDWDCAGQAHEFRPEFNRASLFGELRLFRGQLRLRYGLGDTSYCYAGGRGLDLWYMVLSDDDDEENLSCSAVHGFARSASVSYHWHWQDSPAGAALRLGMEHADLHGRRAIGLPPMRYQAVTLTLQIAFD